MKIKMHRIGKRLTMIQPSCGKSVLFREISLKKAADFSRFAEIAKWRQLPLLLLLSAQRDVYPRANSID